MSRWRGANRPERPYVAFAAANAATARRLYRSQNVVWIWLGLAAVITALSYFLRPDLGPVLVTRSVTLDTVRETLFGTGGLLIALGVWGIRRVVEVLGHVMFATGAILTAVADLTLSNTTVPLILTAGVAVASGFRAFYLVQWIEASDGDSV